MAWITVSEAQRRLDGAVSLGTIYRMIKSGELLGTVIRGRVLADDQSLANLINKGRLRAMSPRARGPHSPQRKEER